MLGSSSTGRRRLRAFVAGLQGDGRGWVLLFVACGWLVLFGMRQIFPVIIPLLRPVFGFDLVTTGLILSMLWGGYALGQIPGGILADRIGERNVLVGAMLATGLGFVVLVSAFDLRVVFLGTFLTGAGAGLFAPTRATVITDLYTERDGTAQGITLAAGNIGSSSFPVAATLLAGYLGWRAGFGFLLPLIAIVALGLWWAVPKRTSRSTPSTEGRSLETLARIGAAISTRSTLLALCLMVVMAFFFQTFTSFYPTYLLEVKGVSEAQTSLIFGLFFAFAIVIQFVAGIVADRIGPANTIVGIGIMTTSGLLLLPLVSGTAVLVFVTAFLSFQAGFWPTIYAYLTPTLPDAIQGSSMGVINSAYLLISATGPATMGVLAARYSFDTAFRGLAGLVVVGIVIALWLPDVATASE